MCVRVRCRPAIATRTCHAQSNDTRPPPPLRVHPFLRRGPRWRRGDYRYAGDEPEPEDGDEVSALPGRLQLGPPSDDPPGEHPVAGEDQAGGAARGAGGVDRAHEAGETRAEYREPGRPRALEVPKVFSGGKLVAGTWRW